MKIAVLALAQSIKIGTGQGDFFKSAEHDIQLIEPFTIMITKKQHGTRPEKESLPTFTTLFNVKYWIPDAEQWASHLEAEADQERHREESNARMKAQSNARMKAHLEAERKRHEISGQDQAPPAGDGEPQQTAARTTVKQHEAAKAPAIKAARPNL